MTTTETIDPEYPGTAVARMLAVRARVKELAEDTVNKPFHGDWEDVRRKLLWAGGLRDLPNYRPGQGYTGHSFQDFNHVDLTTMRMDVSANENDGRVAGIALGNQLGPGIKVASLPELGPGGSWSTCAMGCNTEPKPRDVAHLQFQSRIAFKLVWVPPDFTEFVLVDDAGEFLAAGSPTGMSLPSLRERQRNYRLVQGSKYAKEADLLGHLMAQRRHAAAAVDDDE
eukprot:CAMPEP_0194047192 /NCGR_PEP_ID=MMETSP0009_2-20130614/23616_1 /TAXON_ID=210454 /ORGANISM="Grammatophora oceanica, Strain CCMP 410" /LENGTH=225 /DNA_ID=CAMNT_0038692731 /DNA_START=245 /DNA_END=922 /DNA_ORIENTATION=-